MNRKLGLILVCILFIISSCGKKFELSSNQLDEIAISYLNGIYKIQKEYFDKNNAFGSLRELGEKGIIDPDWAKGVKAAHVYEIILKDGSMDYVIYATPKERKDLGSFLLTAEGLIRGGKKDGYQARLEDPIILSIKTPPSASS